MMNLDNGATYIEASNGAHSRMLSLPVRHDVSLEAKFALENVIKHLVVLACVGIVNKV